MESLPDHVGSSSEDVLTTSQENQSSLIKPIEKDIIHRICSGQVSNLYWYSNSVH